jgi:hypothetical protein
MSLSGHCLCGDITVATSVDPAFQANCHCTDCRRSTGAVYATILFFKEEDVTLGGETGEFHHLSDRGSEMTKLFCPKCGGPVATKNSARPGMIGLRAGLFDQPEAIKPERNVFLDSRIPSTPIDEGIPGAARMPG